MRCILLCAALAGLCSSGAMASNGGNGNGNSGDDGVELELTITGKISPKCEISLPNKRIQTVLTDGAGSESVAFSVNCNQKLSVVMTSANGGFEHPTRDRNENFDGFTNFLPYQATFSVNANDAQPVVAQSEAMLGGAGGSIGVVPHSATGTLELSWQPEQPLLGGVFEDVIEIRVTGAG
jgi:hypothetical protein